VFTALIVIFIILPILEVAMFLAMANLIGGWLSLFVLLAMSLFGVWLVKRQGLAVMRRTRQSINSGEVPTREVLDGTLIAFAGVLCVIPGFLTAIVGLLILTPPVRAFSRSLAGRRFAFLTAATRTIRWRRRSVINVEWIGDVTPQPKPPASVIELGPVNE